ncbi:hypothetical protein D9613_012506 [Agrocybe pediades]|uniref:Cytochrome P450 n=1 Tax=Agrocybe pediades TaxID=84607 RepID=A0A8H4QRT2_9AGAR|nr:hypothetical protein D9613_012506 [Agrocybe pediades]
MGTLPFFATVLIFSILVGIMFLKRKRALVALPPGPPAHPIVGHMFTMPQDVNSGIYFAELAKKYGDVACLRIPGKTMIILNSMRAAVDLLEKRSGIYSSRPLSDVFMLMGWEHNLAFISTGKRVQRQRRMLNEYLSRDKCASYLPSQEREARKLVRNLAEDPEEFDEHLNLFSTGIVVRIAYGHDIKRENPVDDAYFKMATDASWCNTHCAAPGSNLVDLLPIMKYLPSWFPGTLPATQARLYRPIIDFLHEFPFADVQRQMDEGSARESYLLTHIEGMRRQEAGYPYTMDDIKGTAAVMIGAGADTTWSTTATFMLAMLLYPEVQKKAQQEIDAFIEENRLPTFSDRSNLPYVNCIVSETYRWYNAAPTGIPHESLEDDIYRGMFIPKGSVIIPNTRGITLDEAVYEHPHTFDPERYLRGEPHPVAQFGFGRRICPGRHLADASVWIAVASILAAFEINPVQDSNGTPIVPNEDFKYGITR